MNYFSFQETFMKVYIIFKHLYILYIEFNNDSLFLHFYDILKKSNSFAYILCQSYLHIFFHCILQLCLKMKVLKKIYYAILKKICKYRKNILEIFTLLINHYNQTLFGKLCQMIKFAELCVILMLY